MVNELKNYLNEVENCDQPIDDVNECLDEVNAFIGRTVDKEFLDIILDQLEDDQEVTLPFMNLKISKKFGLTLELVDLDKLTNQLVGDK